MNINPSAFLTQPPFPLPSDSRQSQSVLCIYESVSILFEGIKQSKKNNENPPLRPEYVN